MGRGRFHNSFNQIIHQGIAKEKPIVSARLNYGPAQKENAVLCAGFFPTRFIRYFQQAHRLLCLFLLLGLNCKPNGPEKLKPKKVEPGYKTSMMAISDTCPIPNEVISRKVLLHSNAYSTIATQVGRKENIEPSDTIWLRYFIDSMLIETDYLFAPRGNQFMFQTASAIDVKMNSCSKLFFNPDKTTNWKFWGEGIFEVQKQPLTISNNEYQIHIRPKSAIYIFNYKDYDEEPHVKIALLRGKAAITGEITEDLHTGVEYSWVTGKALLSKRVLDLTNITWWTRQWFYFENAPFISILEAISRWYGYPLKQTGQKAPSFQMTYKGPYSDPLPLLIQKLNLVASKNMVKLERNKIVLTTE